MSEPLTLLAPPQTELKILAGAWFVKQISQDLMPEAGAAAFAAEALGWERVVLPHLRRGTLDQDTLWYRHTFQLSSSLAHHILRFEGAFYYTRVWLNGHYLGEHEGYFQPFGFDITEHLVVGENVLVVCCRFPVEAGAFKRKTAVAGIFADWDCKPYPSAFYPHLPLPHTWSVPLGLWQPVSLMACTPILVEVFNVLPQLEISKAPLSAFAQVAPAQLKLSLSLRNLSTQTQQTKLQVVIVPHNFAGGVVAQAEWECTLAPHETLVVKRELYLAMAQLWFPHTHGLPNLYEAQLKIETVSATGKMVNDLSQVFGVRSIQAEISAEQWVWRLNGCHIFPKGSNYVSDFYLDRVSPESLQRDLELARQANLDLLRVHAHIAPLDFYRLCDERGLMVMCDFPLIWTYAFNLSLEADESFRVSVQRQVAEMVQLLGSHPSIVLWSMHNEPPWTPDGSFLGSDVHAAKTNQQLDRRSAEIVRALDVTRPVIAASGETDQHLYHGWYTGSWQDNRELHPRFPTEFGVQALPNLESPFWATVNGGWPIESDEVSWAYAGYQAVFWASPGVGSPAQFTSLADYVKQSQAYQAFFIRYTIDQWRRQKFNPVGGYIHFLFTDGWPAITWSVLDYYRLPKAGYEALREASSPVRLCLDLQAGFKVEHGFQLAYRAGARLVCDLYLVNDDYRQQGLVTVRWWLARRSGWLSKLGNALRAWLAPRRQVELPHADEGAKKLPSLNLKLSADGDYTLQVQVGRGTQVLSVNHLDFRVGAERLHPKAARHVPSLLVNKVYQVKSLRHTAEGFTFTLRNPAMPVVLERLSGLVVDGVPIEPAHVEIVRGGVRRSAATISPQAPLEIPSHELFTILVHNRQLTVGVHELELTAHFLGLGEITAKIKDKLV